MKLSELGTAVETLPGVGPSTARLFARMNIFTVSDLLSSYPRDYEDRTARIPLRDFAQHQKVFTVCKVCAHEWFGYGRMRTLKIAISDGTATAWLIAFNRPFLEKSLPQGSIIAVSGKFEVRYSSLQSTAFEAEKIASEGNIEDFAETPLPGSGILPVYPLTEGLSQKVVRKTVAAALKQYGKSIEDELPPHILTERNILHKAEALRLIHQAQSMEEVSLARRTLKYEELYNFEYKMAQRTYEHRGTLPSIDQTAVFEYSQGRGNAGAGNGITGTQSTPDAPSAAPYFTTPQVTPQQFEASLCPRQLELYRRLPFSLTDGQMSAILEMNADIDKSQAECNTMLTDPKKLERSPFSMQRLLQGDVGSGKTLVAFFVCLRVIDYGGQCVLLAPTELLARQHAENAAKLLEPIGVKVAFLTGNIKASGRDRLINALKAGEVNIAVGTHALFSRNVQYKNLALAVIDEQHRFGVTQRESIIAKGRISCQELSHTPDVLMMSATPIPQTLALTVFGDLDVSTIKTMPQGRKPIQTYLSVMGHESNVYEAVRKELAQGHQAYFVYPRIAEGAEDAARSDGIKSAEEMFTYLSTKIYPKFKCGLIHSKIEEDEQNRILDEFRDNKIQVLVATTVVEVGVDVPNASCIVIEHADRFGLAELHQLRGRVGRGQIQSFCFLIYGKNITEDGIQRMKALRQNSDGFVIAEEDLKLRGPGQVTGTAQSGYLTLGIADLVQDRELLKLARYDAFSELSNRHKV